MGLVENGKPYRVLIIEDHAENKRLLDAVIQDADIAPFSFTSAHSLSLALDCIRRETFEAVILDPQLSGYSGLDAFMQLAAYIPDLPVLIVSPHDDRETATKAIREGAQDYLVLKEGLDPQLLARSLLFAIERQRMHVMLKHISLIDDLTGLLNRRGFMSLTKQTMKIAQRANWELTLLFADLDGLKNVNDRFGHPEGDKALRTVASILRATFRSSDLMARLGGDEYIVLAINASNANIDSIKSRLKENIAYYNSLNSRYKLALSFGMAIYTPGSQLTLEDLISRADEDLYKHKRKNNKAKLKEPPDA